MKQLVGIVLGILLIIVKSPAADQLPSTTRGFPLDAAVYRGQFNDIMGNVPVIPLRRFDGTDSSAELVATGTALTISCYAPLAQVIEAQVDGGAWADITPEARTAPATATVFSNLPDNPHAVTLRAKQAGVFYLDGSAGGCYKVTGAAPSVTKPAAALGQQYRLNATAPDVLGRPGILNNLRLEAGYAPDKLHGYDVLRPLSQAVGAANGYLSYTFGAQFRFQAAIRELAIWTYLDDAKYALVIDGAVQPSVQGPDLNHWGWLTLSTTLDATRPHTYGIVSAFFRPSRYNSGSGSIYALRTRGGSGIDTTSRPMERPLLAFFGDSITANQIGSVAASGEEPKYNDFMLGWASQLSESLGMALVNLGIGSTTVHDFGTNVGTVAKGGLEYLTTDTGEARTNNVTRLAPPPAKVVILYGTNDLGQAWHASGAPLETLAEFKASYLNMLRRIVNGLPAVTEIYCIGILPRSDFNVTEIGPWNEAIRSAVAAVGGRRTHYIDPGPWQLNGATGKDYTTNFMDGLHPNTTGKKIIAAELRRALAGRSPKTN